MENRKKYIVIAVVVVLILAALFFLFQNRGKDQAPQIQQAQKSVPASTPVVAKQEKKVVAKVEQPKPVAVPSKRDKFLAYFGQNFSCPVGSGRLNDLNRFLGKLKNTQFTKRGNVFYSNNNGSVNKMVYYGDSGAFFDANGYPIIDFNMTASTPCAVFHFSFNVSENIVANEYELLRALKMAMDDHAAAIKKAYIFGHTCDIGSYNYNDNLSFNRAKRIADELKALDIDLLFIPNGEYYPVADGKDDDSRAENRRAEIFIVAGNT